jgi:hypothetical protein
MDVVNAASEYASDLLQMWKLLVSNLPHLSTPLIATWSSGYQPHHVSHFQGPYSFYRYPLPLAFFLLERFFILGTTTFWKKKTHHDDIMAGRRG